jgi:FHA domain
MSPEPAKQKIVITKEELQDTQIDEAIVLYRSSVAGPVEPAPQRVGFQLLYTTWFYLLIAGALGGLLAWALIEPYFDDGIVFIGQVERVDPENTIGSLRKVRISSVDVYVNEYSTKITAGMGKASRYAVDDLTAQQIVKVMAEPMPQSPALIASAIRLQASDTPAEKEFSIYELTARQRYAGLALFSLVAGLVGLMVGSVDGVICRTFARAAWCGIVGLVIGLLGGLLSTIFGALTYLLLGTLGENPYLTAGTFVLQMFRRGLAWTIVGTTMGLGPGLALQSGRLTLNGLIGGMVGGLLGGLLFDPVDLMLSDRTLMEGAELSRAVGFTIIGAAVGLMIGLTDLLTRSAWLKVTSGPLRGKEFSFDRTPIRLGSSPKNEIYLFKDPKIDPIHAIIDRLRDAYELSDSGSSTGTFINGQRIRRHRLQDGDQIRIGDSEFIYSTREKKS